MLKNLEDLIKIIRDRKNTSPDKSYTNKLLNDKNLSVSKVKEEVAELIEAVEKNTAEKRTPANGGSEKLSPRSRSVREVFLNFLTFSDFFESFWTCSDGFRCVRMRLDAFGCNRKHVDALGRF